MGSYKPYKFWTKSQLADHLKNLSYALNAGFAVRKLLEEALASDAWDPTMDFDGCTACQDMYHPSLSCFLHDYLWRTGQGGKESDELFYLLMLKEGMMPPKAKRRRFAVRVGWIFYYKWHHFFKRNVEPYSEAFLGALDQLRTEHAGRKAK